MCLEQLGAFRLDEAEQAAEGHVHAFHLIGGMIVKEGVTRLIN